MIHWSSVTGPSERAAETLAAQAKRRTWLLRGPPARCLRRGWERAGGHYAAAAARGLPSRSAWCPVRDPAGVPSPGAVTGRGGGLTGPGAVRYSLQCTKW